MGKASRSLSRPNCWEFDGRVVYFRCRAAAIEQRRWFARSIPQKHAAGSGHYVQKTARCGCCMHIACWAVYSESDICCGDDHMPNARLRLLSTGRRLVSKRSRPAWWPEVICMNDP